MKLFLNWGNLLRDRQSFNIHYKLGDADDDGDVDLTDLGRLAGNYETNEGATWSMGNFDNDGDVDLTDLGILAGNYGSGVQQAMADFQRIVPEPSAVYVLPLIALGAGIIGGLERRVRRK